MERISTSQPVLTIGSDITTKVADYWDKMIKPYEFFLGSHIHFGYAEEGERPELEEATDRLVERLLEYGGGLGQGERVLDCGCGVGGTAVHLAEAYGARVTGVTISAKQVESARALAERRGVDTAEFEVGDAHDLSAFEDGTFDTVWCVESCEQYYDKARFLAEAHRVLAPGGKLIMSTWCSSDEEFTGEDAERYRHFCQLFDCPYLPTVPAYEGLLAAQGFTGIAAEDWSEPINRTWDLPPKRKSRWDILRGYLRGNSRFLRYVFSDVHHLKNGFLSGMVRYGVFRAQKAG